MKKFLVIAFLILCNSQLRAQVHFEKRLARNPDPINSYCQMHGIVQLPTGGYITGGYNDYIHSLTGIDDVDAVIFVTNPMGDTLKTHSFFPSDTSYFHNYNARTIHIFQSFIINKNNEFVGIASIQGHGATNLYDCDILIVKLDSIGDTLLTKQISHPLPGDSAMIPYFIIQTYDGNYMIFGWQNSFFSNKSIGFIMKLDTNFNLQWRKSYINPTKSTYFWKALEAPDHGVFLSGADYDANNQIVSDPFLAKIDSAGNIVMKHIFTSNGYDGGYNITSTNDGNFMYATTLTTGPSGNDTSVYRFIKFSSNGTILSTKTHLRTYGNGVIVTLTTNGSLVTSGWIENNFSTGTVDAFVMGIDNYGDSLWYRQYGGIWPEYVWDMAPTSDGGVILCGETYSNVLPNTNSNAWLLKLDSLGLLITGVKEQTWARAVQLNSPFPNPCNTQFSITTTIPENIENKGLGKTGYELQMYDLQSKPIQYIPVTNGTVTTSFTTTSLAQGTYLLVLVVNGYNVGSQKVVVVK